MHQPFTLACQRRHFHHPPLRLIIGTAKDPKTCFEALVRIVAGQFVSGKSALAAWNKLKALKAADQEATLTPATILRLTTTTTGSSSERNVDADDGMDFDPTLLEAFQKASGVTKVTKDTRRGRFMTWRCILVTVVYRKTS